MNLYHDFLKFMFEIFVRGPGYLLSGASVGITWLSKANLVELLFGKHNHSLTPPPLYISFATFGIGIFIIISMLLIIRSFEKGGTKTALLASGKNIVLFILIIMLIPMCFWAINFITGEIMQLMLGGKTYGGDSFVQQIVNIGWKDGKDHSNFDWTSQFPIWGHYTLTIAIIGVISTLILFFFLSFALVKRLFTIFVYYLISPFVMAKSSASNNWENAIKWKDYLIGAFLAVLAITLSVIAFTIIMKN